MAALDLWHRERLSAGAKEKLRLFKEARGAAPENDTLFEAAFQAFVAELTPRQVSILSEVLDELSADQALH